MCHGARQCPLNWILFEKERIDCIRSQDDDNDEILAKQPSANNLDRRLQLRLSHWHFLFVSALSSSSRSYFTLGHTHTHTKCDFTIRLSLYTKGGPILHRKKNTRPKINMNYVDLWIPFLCQIKTKNRTIKCATTELVNAFHYFGCSENISENDEYMCKMDGR